MRTRRLLIRRNRIRILAAGYVPLDLIVTSRNPLILVRAAGGTCGNVTIILSRLGFRATLLAAIGSDPRGKYLRRDLENEDVDTTNLTERSDRVTGAVVEFIAPDLRGGHRFTFKCPECGSTVRRSNLVTRAQSRQHIAQSAPFDVFFFDRATAATLELARQARRSDTLIVFEPHVIRPGPREEQAVALSDIVKYSADGRAPQGWTPAVKTDALLVVEILGNQGLRYRRRVEDGSWSSWHTMPGIGAANITDTAGAGDWCTAGIIHELLVRYKDRRWTRDSIEGALTYAQSLAAVSIGFPGPRGLLMHTNISTIKRIARHASQSGAVSNNSIPIVQRNQMSTTERGYDRRCRLCLSDINDGT